jgi:hypothetical protein
VEEEQVLAVLVSIILAVLACGFVGLRMLSLARKTRKLPELWMGVGLSAFAIAQASRLALGLLGAGIGAEPALGIYLLMQVGYSGAIVGLCFFTVGAFGSRSSWRRALLVGLVALTLLSRSMLVRGMAPLLLSGAPKQAIPIWDSAAVSIYVLSFAWMAAESLRYHRLLCRRLVLGLADPVVTNRFLVWGAGAGATCLLVLILLALYQQGRTLMTDSLAASIVATASGLVFTVVPLLSFAPPRAYLRFVQRRAERRSVGPA